jgi:small subunit ribosomal protein S17
MKNQLIGKVVSDKMQKTVVVCVQRLKQHPKYFKRYKIDKNYKAHDEKKECKVGDVVMIEECRPISKDKTWKVAKKITENKTEK